MVHCKESDLLMERRSPDTERVASERRRRDAASIATSFGRLATSTGQADHLGRAAAWLTRLGHSPQKPIRNF